MENDGKCHQEGCNIAPSFGTKDQEPLFCKRHSKKEMFNVWEKRCENKGCNYQAVYSPKEDEPKYCGNHAKNGMIVTADVYYYDTDIIFMKCEKRACVNQATFGSKWNEARWCRLHSTKGTINCIQKRCIQCVEDKNGDIMPSKPVDKKYKNLELCKQHGMEVSRKKRQRQSEEDDDFI